MKLNNNEYTTFASVYDTFMDNIPYEEWGAYIKEILDANYINEGKLLDLGCGSGKLSRILAAYNYEVTAVDISEDMLMIARENTDMKKLHITYVEEDITELEVPEGYDAVISTCDTVNYILEPKELAGLFENVYDCLNDEGIFFFDFNTVYKYETVIGDTTIAEDREEAAFIWENEYVEEEKLNIYDLTLFVKEEGNTYRKFQETHYQRGYEWTEIEEMLTKTGFTILMTKDDYTKEPVTCETGRVCVTVIKKRG